MGTWRRIPAAGAIAAVMITLGVEATSAGAGANPCVPGTSAIAPPINDAYLCSLELNRPGTPLNSTNQLGSTVNTTNATVQSNIFSPCGQTTCPTGPAEPTSFGAVTYGKTVWYDFYPDKNGIMQIEASGAVDSVICVYQFALKSLVPNIATRRCENQSVTPLQQSILPVVNAGNAYTVQVGGVATNGVASGGQLDVLFNFFPTHVGASAQLKAIALSDGVKIVSLNVAASQATHVTVRCSNGCRPETKKGGRSVSFPGLKGTTLLAGSKLEIFATKKNTIGGYIQYNIVDGNFTKFSRCLEPGSMTPRRSCH